MATASANYTEATPCDFDPDVPRLIGWRGERLEARPIRRARLWEMRGEPNRSRRVRYSAEPAKPTARESAAASIRLYDAAWARIRAAKGGAA